jgi:hypothetical protein
VKLIGFTICIIPRGDCRTAHIDCDAMQIECTEDVAVGELFEMLEDAGYPVEPPQSDRRARLFGEEAA